MTHYPEIKEKSGRGSRYWLTVAAAAAAVAGSALTAASATAATTESAATGTSRPAAAAAPAAGTVRYAVGKSACTQTPRRGAATCDAIIRVDVAAAQAAKDHAQRFVVGDGAKGNGTIGPAGGLTPADLGTAYNLNTAGGSGQTVGIVDAYNDPNINADLQTFDSHYGLPTCSEGNGCLRVVNQNGNATPLPVNDVSGWSVEETLDVETVHSVCQQLPDHPGRGQLQRQRRPRHGREHRRPARRGRGVELLRGARGRLERHLPGGLQPPRDRDHRIGRRRRLLLLRRLRRDQPAEHSCRLQHHRERRRHLALPRPGRPPAVRVGLERQRPAGLLRAGLRALARRQRRRLQHPVQRQGLAEVAQQLGQHRLRIRAAGQRRLGRRRLPHRIRHLRLLQLRRRVQPGPGLVHPRRHLAVVADHRRDLRAGRRRPRRQLPGAHPLRAPEPGL